jgi:death-on-curing protein
MDFIFLGLEEILEIHADQIKRYGGAREIRDLNLIQSALAMPMAGFGGQYLHHDIFEMAAAYLFHIVQNHPFIDGNKRTGGVSAIVFLYMNGVPLESDQDSFESMVRSVAQGKLKKADVAEFFRKHTKS